MTQPTLEQVKHYAAQLARYATIASVDSKALHTYKTPEGEPLYWRIRLKCSRNGDKFIRPFMWNGTAFENKEPPAPPEGKPLYGLERLTTHPEAVVIITEGEIAADALNRLFSQLDIWEKPNFVALTSGGAQSAKAADWQPLAGRTVYVFPDNDDPGAQYGLDVVQALQGIAHSAAVLDIAPLNLPPKGDAVEWLQDGGTLGGLMERMSAADNVATPDNTQPAPVPAPNTSDSIATPTPPGDGEASFCEYGSGRFELAAHGVSYIGTDKDGNEAAPRWLCSPLRVVAMTRDAKSGEWGRLLEWFDEDNVRHQWAMPMELLQGDGGDVRRELARLGLSIAPSKAARDLLASYVQVWPVDSRARCVERLGWHGAVYVTPDESIGQDDEIVVFQNAHAIEPAFAVSGTAAQWRDSVAALAAGNSRLVFALSVAFAGALADVVGEDSGGFHLRGGSSSGKSTALKAAASVWGDPATYPRLWRATANGLEGLASLHNDGLLILDELSQIDPREAGEAAYLLANGQGKARASRSGTARQSARWRLLFLSAGEESLTALMARVGKKANAGQEIRLADVEADAGAGMGAFEVLHHQPSPAALALAVKDAATRYHGAVGVQWLRRIVADRTTLADSTEARIQQFVAECVPANAAGQVLRVARRFALVAVAGELATRYGLTGWPEGEARTAAKKCFTAWLEAFGGCGNREERAILEQVRAFFEAHGASRFEDMNAKEQRIPNRAGVIRHTADGTPEYLVFPEAFKREVCQGFDQKAATQALMSAGWITPGNDGKASQKPRIAGMGPTRCYVFNGKMWAGE